MFRRTKVSRNAGRERAVGEEGITPQLQCGVAGSIPAVSTGFIGRASAALWMAKWKDA